MSNIEHHEGLLVSGLPVPSGGGNFPQPSGPPGNLMVLDWAGFKGAVSYTYDDAQPSHIDHYDELQATGVRMTFYISSNVNWIPNSDTFWRQVARDGHELGNHTASHPYANLTGGAWGTTLATPAAEIDACTKYIVEELGQFAVWTMAAPYGDLGWSTVAKSKVFLNRGVGGGTIGPNDYSDPFNLPCYMAKDRETAETFNQLIDAAWSEGHWLILLFHTISPTRDNWYAPVKITEITKSVEYAKAQGEIWIDTVANIGAYWLGQKLFTAVTPTVSGDEQTWTWTLPDHFPKGKFLRVRVDGGTLRQGDKVLQWDANGYYEVALDEGKLTLRP